MNNGQNDINILNQDNTIDNTHLQLDYSQYFLKGTGSLISQILPLDQPDIDLILAFLQPVPRVTLRPLANYHGVYTQLRRQSVLAAS